MIQHWQVQRTLVSSMNSNFQVQISNIPSEAQQGLSAPTFLLLSQDIEPGISKVDALQRNYMNTTHINPFLFCWIILFSVPPGMPGGYSSCKTSFSEMLSSMDFQSLNPECPLGTTSGWDVSPAITKAALSSFLALWISATLEITQTP